MQKPRTDTTVVLIHGWGGHALVMGYLAWRLRTSGFSTLSFSYPSIRCSPEENADRLRQRVRSITTPTVHFVAHSLGGIVLLHMLHKYTLANDSRLVLLAVPVQGSSLTHRARQSLVGRLLLRKLARSDQLNPLKISTLPGSINRRSMGLIAGTDGFSLTGKFFGGTEHGDGVIELNETTIDGAVRCELQCSHTRMIFSRRCAEEVTRFLCSGGFSQENATMGEY